MFERIWNLFRRSPASSVAVGAIPLRQDEGPEIVERRIPRADLDPDAVKIVQRLTRYRHASYMVGGCVRDLLLGLKPKDFDIATSATPRQVKRLFRNSRVIGRRFRLAHVYFRDGKIIEVATFRSQEEGNDDSDGDDVMIRDDNVFGTLAEDALRRDFTINQLYYDLEGARVIDHAHGLADLEQRLVRTIGEPELRFREDPIRILRAIKFAARLDLSIEETTLAALKATKGDIPKAAAPRILEEINRFCLGGRVRRSFELLFEHGVFEVILPEIHALYANDASHRELLLSLLEGLDERTAAGNKPELGEILAAMLLPAIAGKLGWTSAGQAEQPRGLNTRDLVDDTLRPLAVRLRISRRDQETCRQIVMTLFRMVPHDRLRRNSKRSLLRRQCLPSAVWILGRLGASWGGVFASATEHWSRYKAELRELQRDRQGDEQPRDRTEQPGRGREEGSRRRGRRGGRGRGRRGNRSDEPRTETEDEAKSSSAPPKPKPGENGWDEDYFFSALPTVPQLGEDDGTPNRYGTVGTGNAAEEPERRDEDADVTAEGDGPTDEEPRETGETGDGDRPRRRRRRRRRRRPAAEESDNSDE